MIKVAVITLGCDKNTVDSEKLLGLLVKNNYELTLNINKIDILIINTCGFIQSAKEESINTILEYVNIKEKYNFKIIVTGCLAQRYAKELYNEIPGIDAVLGLNYYENFCDLINKIYYGENLIEIKKLNLLCREKFGERILETPKHYAYLKIAEGCNNNCAYCVIPKIKGSYRSAIMEDLIKESKYLVNKGVKEIILIAQDTSLYGYDLSDNVKLSELLLRLSEINNLKWLRLLYCYPSNITDELIDVIAGCEKICKYIDMPLQHADNNILRKMNRKHDIEKIEKVIYKLRSKIPEIALRSTFIIGFPGEKNKHFNNLLSFIEKYKFDWAGFFKYSKEEGTYAAKLNDQVSYDIINERFEMVHEVQKHITIDKNMKQVGRRLPVIVENKINSNTDLYEGRSYRNCPDVDGTIFIKSKNINIGEIVNCKITEVQDYDLIGEVK